MGYFNMYSSLLTEPKYLKYISSIRIMHSDNSKRQLSITKQLDNE